jgi:hypothetical protein
VKVEFESTTEIKITDPATLDSITISITESYIFSASLSDISATSPMKSVQCSGGFKGVYGPSTALLNLFYETYPGARLRHNRNRERQRQRRLEDEEEVTIEEATVTEIENPIVCVNPGETVVFGVSQESYPVYLKDSLTNTVKDFDYGAFLLLDERLTMTDLDTDTFLFVFDQPGSYVFGDSADNDDQIVIVVQDEECGEAYIVPITEDTIDEFAVVERDDVIGEKTLWYFILVIALFIGIFVAGVVLIHFLLPKLFAWIKTGKDPYTVVDRSKFAELDEEEQYREMQNMLKRGDEGVDSIFFIFLNEKLKETDEKMRDIFQKANMSTIKKLKKLVKRIRELEDIFSEHFNALITNEGLTIEEYLAMYDDSVNAKDANISSYFTSRAHSSASSRRASEGSIEFEEKKIIEIPLEKETIDTSLMTGEGKRERLTNRWFKVDRDQVLIKRLQKQEDENKVLVDDEMENKKKKYRTLLEEQNLDDNEIKRQMDLYQEKLIHLQRALEEENKVNSVSNNS